jgi:MSHA biogenesis protein MshK
MNARAILRMAGLAVLLAGVTATWAQALRDPTRPPGRSTARDAPAASGGFVLQSILNSPERKAAVINGKVVGPGESVDGFMLVGIAEDEAVLKNGSDVRRLRLYPSIAMKKVKDAPEGAAESAGNKQ